MSGPASTLTQGISPLPKGYSVNWRWIDWIWHVRGTLPLTPGQSGEDAFDRLAPLFGEAGTSHDRRDGILTFRKKDQAAQDKMSVFDSGILMIERGGEGALLRYRLVSRALLFCFLAPFLFLGIAGFTIGVGKLQGPSTEAADAKKKDADKPAAMNPIDKMLGAPAPEKPDKKKAEKDKDKDKKPSPTSSYVFAGIFAALYVVGRLLEDRLIKSLFRKKLLGL